tara:strand:+ start:494 stop:895 length:402 start_codon:yes stop_codon:yes gene_type:complete
MPIRFLQKVSGFETQTLVAGSGSNNNTFTIDFSAEANNYLCNPSNGANVNFVFSNIKKMNKQGNIIITNPSSAGSLSFSVPALPATAFSPGGSQINFDTTANAVAIISYHILTSTKVLINYVGSFQSYDQSTP